MPIVGICGDNCAFCPRYIAAQSRRIQELEKVKELWVRLGLRNPDFPPRALSCNGCTPENKCAYVELRTCVISKGIENCGSCNKYPCEIIKAVFANSERLRRQASQVCTKGEMELLHKAFFAKKEYFDNLHRKIAK
jgi:hypothetical protein